MTPTDRTERDMAPDEREIYYGAGRTVGNFYENATADYDTRIEPEALAKALDELTDAEQQRYNPRIGYFDREHAADDANKARTEIEALFRRLEAEREALAERVEALEARVQREAAIRQEALSKLVEADKAIERYKVDNDRMGWILDNGASLESFDGDGTWAVYVPRVVGPDVEWERLAEGHTPRQAIDAARTTLEKGESDE